MDEPTGALTEKETQMLFEVMRDIKAWVAIIYITHRLDEIKHIADTVTVLRDGKVIWNCGTNDVDIDNLVKVMTGIDLVDRYPKIKVKRETRH